MAKRAAKRAFTLIELMVVVAIIGVLASMAIYGVRRYLLHSKTAEARSGLGRLAKDASASYQREVMDPAIIPPRGSTPVTNNLCDTATKAVPDDPEMVKGKKYQSSLSEWRIDADDQGVGFACLGFYMSEPQYYRYSYAATGIKTSNQAFTAMAEGDLNGDDIKSRFSLVGMAASGAVWVSPNIAEDNPEE